MRIAAAVFVLACSHPQHEAVVGSPSPVPAEVRRTVDAILGPRAKITSELEGRVTTYEAATQTKNGS